MARFPAVIGAVALFFSALLAVVIVTTPAQAAQNVRLLQPKGIGVTKAVLESYEELLRVALVQEGYHVASGQASLTFKGTITKVGSGFLLGLEKSGEGEEPYEDTLRIGSADELDTGTRRLVKSVLAGGTARDGETVDDVTKAEADSGTLRKKTVRHTLFAFGPARAYGLGTSDLLYNFELGYVWERDHIAPRIFAEANWAPGSSQVGSAHAGLGLDYYLFGSRSTPYVGLDVGLGAVSRARTAEAKMTDNGRTLYSGFTAGADVGFAVLRTSDVSLFLQLGVRPQLGGIAGKAAGIYTGDIGILF